MQGTWNALMCIKTKMDVGIRTSEAQQLWGQSIWLNARQTKDLKSDMHETKCREVLGTAALSSGTS